MRHLRTTLVPLAVGGLLSACSAKPEVESFVHALTTGDAEEEDETTTGGTTTGVPEGTTGAEELSCSLFGGGELDGECADGEKCNVAFATDIDVLPECVPIVGDGQPGEACSTEVLPPIDSCAAGSTCLANEFDRNGRCVQFCDETTGCDRPEEICAPVFGGDLRLCVQPCDPLNPATCGDWVCHELREDLSWYCAPQFGGQTGGHGSPCTPEGLGLCAPGFACLEGFGNVDSAQCLEATSSTGCCGLLCELDGETECPSELEQCVPFYNAPPPGMESLGICALSNARPGHTPTPEPIPPLGPRGPD